MSNTTPLTFDREDLWGLIGGQDRMADTTEAIAKALLIRNMEVPDSLKEILVE